MTVVQLWALIEAPATPVFISDITEDTTEENTLSLHLGSTAHSGEQKGGFMDELGEKKTWPPTSGVT